jgi:hypothetical protein
LEVTRGRPAIEGWERAAPDATREKIKASLL